MPKIELLNCPFCGGKAERVLCQDRDEYGSLIGFPFWAVKCKSCGAEIWNPEEQDGLEPDEMIEAAVKAWNTRASGWISCSERLPENETEVLIFCPDFCDRIKKAMFIEDGFYEERTDLIVKPGEYCTHWMPLPEPPKGV